jgi:ferritin
VLHGVGTFRVPIGLTGPLPIPFTPNPSQEITMKLSAPVQKAMNDQIGKEFNAAHLYLAMSVWFAQQNLDGFAKWMRLQSREESDHALKLIDYLLDRGAEVSLQEVERPKTTWKTPLAAFKAAAKHEADVSASILALYEMAGKAGDPTTQVMLQWFLTEQVEEEKSSEVIVERLRLVGESVPGLLMLDRQLGERSGA